MDIRWKWIRFVVQIIMKITNSITGKKSWKFSKIPSLNMSDVCRFSRNHVVECSETIEMTALTTTSHPPKVWEHHVDDVFSIIRKSNLHDFFQRINSLHPKTKFTMETEQNSQLLFLDTLIQRKSDNTIFVRVYGKPAHTDQYLKFTRAKKSVITSPFDRAKNIISNPSDQEKEENHLTAVLQANGYPKKFINNTIRASQLPRQPANNKNTENPEQMASVRINLPYVRTV